LVLGGGKCGIREKSEGEEKERSPPKEKKHFVRKGPTQGGERGEKKKKYHREGGKNGHRRDPGEKGSVKNCLGGKKSS